MNKFFVLFTGVLFPSLVFAADPTAIMKKSEEASRINSLISSAKIMVGEKGGASKIKGFDSWRSLKSDGVHYDTLTRFVSPADIQGEAVLMQEFKDNQNDVFVYLPRFKRTRRVDGQDQSKSFMGTVFSYSDVATFHYDNYTYRYLREADCKVEPGKCHVIEATPANDEVKKRTRYSKSVHWVRADNHLLLVTFAYDLEGKLLKQISASRYQAVAGGKWFPRLVKAVNLQNQKFSSLEYLDPKVNVPVDASLFTEERMSSAQ